MTWPCGIEHRGIIFDRVKTVQSVRQGGPNCQDKKSHYLSYTLVIFGLVTFAKIYLFPCFITKGLIRSLLVIEDYVITHTIPIIKSC